MLPLSIAFIVIGSIVLSSISKKDQQFDLPSQMGTSFLNTETKDVNAQTLPQPPTFIPILSSTPIPPPASPTPIPTTRPPVAGLSCNSGISYSGSGMNLQYILTVDTVSANSETSVSIDFSPYISNKHIEIIEFTGNCRLSSQSLITCENLSTQPQVFFKVINEYKGDVSIKIDTTKELVNHSLEKASCNASMTVEGINTPPPGMPGYNPVPGGSLPIPTQVCEPMKEYCNPPGANLLDDVLFGQSHDGSFENPICTLQPDGTISGKGCSAVLDQATHYQADTSALLPINSQTFFTEGSGYQKPEYVRQEVAGEQQCQEKLTAHGNNSFKIFSRGGHGLKGGICLPMKPSGNSKTAGINFRVSQETQKSGGISKNVPVVFKLGYITSAPQNNTYFDSNPSLSENDIKWVKTKTITSADYGGAGSADRYAGGFLEGQFPADAQGFCFMAESSNEGNGINTFWDAGFAYTGSEPVCENALAHSDGVDRSCGGYGCGGIDPTYSGNYYTDFDQKYYTFNMPSNWNAKQCHYESTSNGAKSLNGTLFVGLDINNCDPNYKDPARRNLHPDYKCENNDKWTYGYAWTGGVKDFGLLQYLDCAMGTLKDDKFKGTESNPFFCSQILKAYSNTRTQPQNDDPAFTLRFSNTYSGLASSIQAEGNTHFWKVPLLGSAIGTGVINNKQVSELKIDPFLIGTRNSGSGLNNMLKYNMGKLADYLISKELRVEEHQFTKSIVPKNEVMITGLLAKSPVCSNIQGDPITKIHYGPTSGVSDRAVFGFADDEGSSEHIIEEKNFELTPKELCNLQFRGNRVTGATCTFLKIGEGKKVTFTESNINNSLEQEGFIRKMAVPTYPPPQEPGIPLPGYDECSSVNLCGKDFECGDTMRQLYDACIDNRDVDEIGGNPFIRQEMPNGWKDLQIHGLNKLMEATWHNEFIQYNNPIRHENVGIDINQVASIYDQQLPECTALSGDRKPIYCTEDPMVNKAQQVCRRASPYDCGCNSSNFSTCLLNCPALFQRPGDIPSEGLDIEGTPLPTPSIKGEKSVDTSIRAILNNGYPSFLEKFVKILKPKTYEGDGGQNYKNGQIYKYSPMYSGGFLLATTGSGTTQCTTDSSQGSKTGASQVRMENYYAYVGQVPRMNERIGFAATNNKDPDTLTQLDIDTNATSIAQFEDFITRGGTPHEHITLPYCDLLTEEEKSSCNTSTDNSCDCLVRTCEQQFNDKLTILDKYLPKFCKLLREDGRPEFSYIFGPPYGCEGNLKDGFVKQRFQPALEQCKATPKTNLDFNCDPMANYLISQGFDTPELRLAACDDIINDNTELYGNLQCIEGGIYGLIKKVANGINAQSPRISAEAIYAIGIHEGFGNGLSGDPNELVQTNATLGNDANRDGQISPPCTTAVRNNCEYDVRGPMQFQNFTFHNITTSNYSLMKACTDAIGIDYAFRGPIDEGMLAIFGGDMNTYNQYEFSRMRVGDNICAAAIFIANLGISETGNSVSPEMWEQASLSFEKNDGKNLIFRVAGRYLGVTDYDTCTFVGSNGPEKHYEYCNQVADSAKATYERGVFDNISGEECSNFIGYSGTCQEIFNQVKQEEAFSAISATAQYSEEVTPFFRTTFAQLNPGSHMCSMNHYGINNTLYCFEKGIEGSQVPLSVCEKCPVRATALFRHELNHAVTPIGGLGRTWSEFSAEAVSNNGGWYMFQHRGQWLFATQIIQRISNSTGIPVTTINNFLNGKITNPGINFQTEVTDICHYNGGDAIGVTKCPTKQIPPGLEQSNCNNVGTPAPVNLPTPIQLGFSEGGNPINVYKFGNGANKILFVGGVHGGYEWNSILLAYEAIEYFAENSEAVPNSATLYIIPSANPDGQKQAGLGVGPFPPGSYPANINNRYNYNGVDINRNFDCKWTSDPQGPGGLLLTGKGGTSVFSEKESQILRNFIITHKPKASVFWHSAGGFISPAGCGDSLYQSSSSVELANTYGGYRVITDSNPFSYQITGDITNWMETIGLSGISVELQSRNNSEFSRNMPGMLKILQKYGIGNSSTPTPEPM